MRVEVRRRVLRLREPLRAAWGELRERTVLELEVEGSDGAVGVGEAAPLEPYDGVSLARCEAALGVLADLLRREGDRLEGGALLDACRAAADLPQALAAVDLALWDRAGRRAGRPVAALLADAPLPAVAVNATIGALDRAGAATAAARAAAAGFGCVKVKVGVGDDAGRVAAVRAAAGPAMALRLDANGAWTVDEAVRMIEVLAPAGLELVEEPVHGVEAMQTVRERVPVRVALDETADAPGALTARVADAVCLKVSRAGGIAALLAQASLVRATGADVYLASTYDGPRGVAAALHAAAALRVELPCGLATLGAFEDVGVLPVADGAIAVPDAPGLGV
ncbi:MAG TPA: mandelate racemase/muconate lactonizing enzyme family protein [Capillimicrobium sp.]|nr:mandelate racemase/muconate lactonizing enzyme family protein [Capillimicrobium sp.]